MTTKPTKRDDKLKKLKKLTLNKETIRDLNYVQANQIKGGAAKRAPCTADSSCNKVDCV
jgi:natural product precursor